MKFKNLSKNEKILNEKKYILLFKKSKMALVAILDFSPSPLIIFSENEKKSSAIIVLMLAEKQDIKHLNSFIGY